MRSALKPALILLCSSFFFQCSGQQGRFFTKSKQKGATNDGRTIMPVILTDSFRLCDRWFRIPHDRDGDSAVNCCSVEVLPKRSQLNCNNGLSLSWTSLPDQASWRSSYQARIFPRSSEKTGLERKTISCLLFGKEVEGEVMTYTNSKGQFMSTVVAKAFINDEYLIFQLLSAGDITTRVNDQVSDLIKQIFWLKKEVE